MDLDKIDQLSGEFSFLMSEIEDNINKYKEFLYNKIIMDEDSSYNKDVVTNEDHILCIFLNICKYNDARETSSSVYEIYRAIINNKHLSHALKHYIVEIFYNEQDYMFDYYEEKIGYINIDYIKPYDNWE